MGRTLLVCAKQGAYAAIALYLLLLLGICLSTGVSLALAL
ncbi:hypothetical protein C4K39_2820 [Pseudomonas sessilinigenes]|nr:hypothetical protein C4K39_2820 [Pseudomonas sessilinigenes]